MWNLKNIGCSKEVIAAHIYTEKKMRKVRVNNKKIRTSKEIQFFYNSDNFFQKNAPELEK